MKSVWMLSGACALTVLFSGCSPELDQTQLSPEEQAWAANFKENYSAWQPPESVPRSVRRDDLAHETATGQVTSQQVSSELVPPAVDQPAAVPGTETPVNVEEVKVEEVKVETVDVPAAPAAPAEVAPATPAAPAADEVYTVVKGDTLGGIALKYYGRASQWKKIQQANMQVLRGKNKDIVVPGMKLQIPR